MFGLWITSVHVLFGEIAAQVWQRPYALLVAAPIPLLTNQCRKETVRDKFCVTCAIVIPLFEHLVDQSD